MILYHGSNAQVEAVDLLRCRPNKDFGQGFYLTPDKSSARQEYSAGSAKANRRVAAPVTDACPDTGYWLNSNSNKRHNRNCEYYRKTRGVPCQKNEGSPCGKCGG